MTECEDNFSEKGLVAISCEILFDLIEVLENSITSNRSIVWILVRMYFACKISSKFNSSSFEYLL